jgi:LEA14-like dessication related protein
MKRVKWLLLILVILIAATGSWWWWSNASSSKLMKNNMAARLTPRFNVGAFNITEVNADRIKMNVNVTVSNPFPVALNTRRISYQIFVDTIKVADDVYEKKITIPSSDSAILDLPLELLTKPMKQAQQILDSKNADSVGYTVKANIEVNLPVGGSKNFPVLLTKKLPLIQFPEIEITNADLDFLNMESNGVRMQMKITNSNSFPITMKDGSFNFKIEDDIEMRGLLAKTVTLPPGQTQKVSMQAMLTKGNVAQAGLKLLTRKNQMRFIYTLDCTLTSENRLLQNSKMRMSNEGKVGDLVNAVGR